MLAACACAGLMSLSVACDKDDDIKNIPDEYTAALAEKFPDAKNVVWEKDGSYKKAEFSYTGYDREVWFDKSAKWAMTTTEYNLHIEALPKPVVDAFYSSEYSTWELDDVEGYERPDVTFYVIDVEDRNDTEREIYITSEGTITKVVPYDVHEITPTTPYE